MVSGVSGVGRINRDQFNEGIDFRDRNYRLINGFEADYHSGRRDESYAKKVGTVEFVLGLILLAAALLLMIFA